MSKLTRSLFFLAKTRAAGQVVGSCFAHGSFLIPVKRLYETPSVLAFYHPKPAYPHHVVIVPKKAIPNLLVLSEYPDYAMAILTAAQAIVAQFQWKHGTYVLCANGGSRQEVQQVHFHLFFEDSPLREPFSYQVAFTRTIPKRCLAKASCLPRLRFEIASLNAS